MKSGVGYYNSVVERENAIADKANNLIDNYNQKATLANDWANRVTALEGSVTKEMYLELKRRNNEALKSGEIATSYINANFDSLDSKTSSAFLSVVAENKGKLGLQNQEIEIILNDIQKQDTQNKAIDEQNQKEAGIFSNANRLNDDYAWKLDLVTEIQQRTDALGNGAGRSYYVEWINRNNEAIYSGETLATYLEENRDVLDNGVTKNWASDLLTLIAKNKVTIERDNQGLNQVVNAP